MYNGTMPLMYTQIYLIDPQEGQESSFIFLSTRLRLQETEAASLFRLGSNIWSKGQKAFNTPHPPPFFTAFRKQNWTYPQCCIQPAISHSEKNRGELRHWSAPLHTYWTQQSLTGCSRDPYTVLIKSFFYVVCCMFTWTTDAYSILFWPVGERQKKKKWIRSLQRYL